ncbi:MAG: thioredoxin fold domain-containing protein [Nitrospinae bacterium]|nr:thioredoxin fold domain-containing protein [Nitrospinota bacterium]
MFQPHFGNLQEELATATANNKRLVVYFWQENCPYCDQIEKEVFSLSKVKTQVGERFSAIDVNIFGAVEITGFNGVKTNEKGFSNSLKVSYTPTVVFFEKDGSEAFRLPGFWREPHFLAAVSYVGDGEYKKTSFQDFLRYKWFNPENKKEGGE